MREVLQQSLAAWRKLPENRRLPGAVSVPPLGTVDTRYLRRPPEKGLVLKAWTRLLERSPSGDLKNSVCDPGQGGEAARDYLWLTAQDATELLPSQRSVGYEYPLAKKVAMRLIRFHLVDNTRGEPPFWKPEELRACDLTLKVTAVTQDKLQLTIQGNVLVATSPFLRDADRGFQGKINGQLQYNQVAGRWEEIQMTVLGQHWGEGPFTRGARPGKSWLGVALELVTTPTPWDLIPPQGARDVGDYYGK